MRVNKKGRLEILSHRVYGDKRHLSIEMLKPQVSYMKGKRLFVLLPILVVLFVSGCASTTDTAVKKDPLQVLETAMQKAAGVASYSGSFDVIYKIGQQEITAETQISIVGDKKKVSVRMQTPPELKNQVKGSLDSTSLDLYLKPGERTICVPGDSVLASSSQAGASMSAETQNKLKGNVACSKSSQTNRNIMLDPSAFIAELKKQVDSGLIGVEYIGLASKAGRQCDLLRLSSRQIADTASQPEVCIDVETGMVLDSKIVLFLDTENLANNPTVIIKAKSFSIGVAEASVEPPANSVDISSLSEFGQLVSVGEFQ